MLIKQAHQYLSNTGRIKLYILIIIIPLILGVIQSIAIATITKETQTLIDKNKLLIDTDIEVELVNTVIYYLTALIVINITKFISPILNSMTKKHKSDILEEIKTKMQDNFMNKYETLSYASKCESRITDYMNLLDEASRAISYVLGHVMENLISLITGVINSFILFWSNGAINVLMFLIVINIISYKLCYQKIITNTLATHKKLREEIREKQSLQRLVAELFHSGQKNASDLLLVSSSISHLETQIGLVWSKLYNSVNYTNAICSVILCYCMYDDIVKMPMILLTFKTFCQSSSEAINFGTDLEYFNSKYESLLKFFEGKVISPLAPQFPLPNVLVVTNVYVERKNFTLRFDNIMKFKVGGRYLLVGKSGHGKTTLVNGLMGKIAGVTTETLTPENYTRSFIEMPQNIKEHLPTSKITVRQLFQDEADSELILRCARICCVDDKVLTLNENNYKYSCLDTQIKERISGGEKTRLAIATRIYCLIKEGNEKSALILDEPEQGSDPVVAYQIIENILKEFPFTRIIVVSHLELVQQKFKWHKIYRVEHGNISVVD